MFCGIHNQRIAIRQCEHCEAGVCEECQVILKGQFFCRKCAASVSIPSHNVPTHKRDAWIALLLSVIFPGIGQVYNGQVGKGIVILLTSFLVIPYLYGIYDAYATAGKINRGEIESAPSMANLAGCLVLVLMMGLGPFIIFKVFKPQVMGHWQKSEAAKVLERVNRISKAAENYRKDKGEYPTRFADLYSAQPPYIEDLLCEVTIDGYDYACSFLKEGYSIKAVPGTGYKGLVNMTYTITTGGVAAVTGDNQDERLAQ